MQWSRALIAALSIAAVGCSFQGPGGNGGDGDADAGADASDCAWAPINFDVCQVPGPSAGLDLAGGEFVYDTSTGILTAPDNSTSEPANALLENLDPPVRVIRVESFNLSSGAELRVRGVHPIIIASESTISVSAFINAASIDISVVGAGADPAVCEDVPAGPGGDNLGGAGGGGGGGNQGMGGSGGVGDVNSSPTSGGNGGGVLSKPTTPRGGCRGNRGGTGDANGGTGGRGGGAVQLSARTSIAIGTTALIAASGGGGVGGEATDGGGGGGGAGGYVGLDAPTVTLASGARLIANGGGGGGGADNDPGTSGGSAADSADPAPGGPGGGGGSGSGGDGGALASPSGANVTTGVNRANGGGGGGVGYILLFADELDDQGAVISPAPATTSPRR